MGVKVDSGIADALGVLIRTSVKPRAGTQTMIDSMTVSPFVATPCQARRFETTLTGRFGTSSGARSATKSDRVCAARCPAAG